MMSNDEEIAGTLIEMTKVRDLLLNQLFLTKTEILAIEKQAVVETGSIEALNTAIEQSCYEVLELNANILGRNNILKMTLFGQEAFQVVHQARSENQETDESLELLELIEKLNQINRDCLVKMKELEAMEQNYDSTKIRLRDVQVKNRELSSLLDYAEKGCDVIIKQKEAEDSNSKIHEDKEKLEKLKEEISLRRSTFQSLIHASKVDWFHDKHLREIIISTGEPVVL